MRQFSTPFLYWKSRMVPFPPTESSCGWEQWPKRDESFNSFFCRRLGILLHRFTPVRFHWSYLTVASLGSKSMLLLQSFADRSIRAWTGWNRNIVLLDTFILFWYRSKNDGENNNNNRVMDGIFINGWLEKPIFISTRLGFPSPLPLPPPLPVRFCRMQWWILKCWRIDQVELIIIKNFLAKYRLGNENKWKIEMETTWRWWRGSGCIQWQYML